MTVCGHRRVVVFYEPDLGSIKGKPVRFKTGHVKIDVIVLLPDVILELYGSITLFVDILFVDNLIFVGIVSRKVNFITATQIESRKHIEIFPIIMKIIMLCRARGFKTKFLLIDGEFAAMKLKSLEQGVLLNGTAANANVPENKLLFRTVKERERHS